MPGSANACFDALRRSRNVAVRLVEVRRYVDRSWVLRGEAQDALLSGRRGAGDLTDNDLALAICQKSPGTK